MGEAGHDGVPQSGLGPAAAPALSLKEGQAFLTALSRYVDFRLTDEGQTKPTPEHLQVYAKRFAAFVKTRPGAKSHPEMVKKLVEKMSMLKTARGPATVRPDSKSRGD